MPKKGESPYKRTVGLDVPHPFAKLKRKDLEVDQQEKRSTTSKS